jgi:hypothetical protein
MITKNTSLGGRRNRGRFYLPWAVDEGQVGENGAISNTQVNSLQARANKLLLNMAGGVGTGWPLLDGAMLLHNDEYIPTPITGLVANPTIRTQRRRQVRY